MLRWVWWSNGWASASIASHRLSDIAVGTNFKFISSSEKCSIKRMLWTDWGVRETLLASSPSGGDQDDALISDLHVFRWLYQRAQGSTRTVEWERTRACWPLNDSAQGHADRWMTAHKGILTVERKRTRACWPLSIYFPTMLHLNVADHRKWYSIIVVWCWRYDVGRWMYEVWYWRNNVWYWKYNVWYWKYNVWYWR